LLSSPEFLRSYYRRPIPPRHFHLQGWRCLRHDPFLLKQEKVQFESVVSRQQERVLNATA